ncbi:serine hydrolase domain-containing protein [Kordiimonas pumila]|uniref:Serine hydrolase domain-containing protein n=1 Tax=Kordiimonas pumila TaxID=2161677 RepID=A0ABV7D5B5_9PROT|nr:serine hydrolase domain-containing protein [Kordiimonas pumila]
MCKLVTTAILCGLLGFGCNAETAEFTTPPALASDQAILGASTDEIPTHIENPKLIKMDVDVWLDGFVPSRIKRSDVAGAIVVIVKDGLILTQRGYGYADIAAGLKVDAETTLFRPGSTSKLITWTAVMQQVERGTIDLDHDINTYLDFKIPPFNEEPITMRNLMTHTPGFQEQLKDLLLFDPAGRMALGEFLKNEMPPRVYKPGQVPSYSNYGAALAGYIVQRVSGQSFEDYVEDHVFHPLSMSHASFRQPLPPALQISMSRGYGLASSSPKAYEMFPAPAGSAAMTGPDMAKFMIAHLQGGEYRGVRILKPETARMMHDSPFTTINSKLNRMQLGFYSMNRNGHRIIGHDGDTRFFHSAVQLFLDDNVGIFVSFNSVGRDDGSRAIRTDLLNGFADRYFPGSIGRDNAVPDTAHRDGMLIAGRYSSAQRWQVGYASLLDLVTQSVVTVDDSGRITASAIVGENGQLKQFEEVEPFLWREVGGTTLLGAKVVDGKVTMWSYGDTAPIGAFLPVPVWRSAGWINPLLLLSIGVLLLALLLQPIGALLRRWYASKPAINDLRLPRRLWMQGSIAGAVLLMLGWLGTIGWIVSEFSFTSALDPWIRVLQILSFIVFPLAALMSVWYMCAAFAVFKGWRKGLVCAWNIMRMLSCATLLYVAIAFGLIGTSLAL